MALSDNAAKVLDELPLDPAKSRYYKKLMNNLRLTHEVLDDALRELQGLRLITRQPKDGKQIARAPREVVLSGLSATAKSLFEKIPADGASIGGTRLRSIMVLSNESYRVALGELRRRGLVSVGRGHGGSVARTVLVEPVIERANRGHESDLYEPFLTWLQSARTPVDAGQLREAIKTATPKGYARSSGTWTRPDVTEIHVDSYDLLPAVQRVQLEITSYEIKPKGSPRLEWVYAAAAQSRWAHRSVLVLAVDDVDAAPDDRIVEEVRRFNLGLYHLALSSTKGASKEEADVKVLLEPGLQAPEPGDLQDVMQRVLDMPASSGLKPDFATKYRALINSRRVE